MRTILLTALTFLACAIPATRHRAGAVPEYHLYYANLHSHTNYSDGKSTPKHAYAYARDTAHIDILAVTDHAEHFDHDTMEWVSCGRAADSATIPGRFLALRGFEWSKYGHANVFNTSGYCSSYRDDSIPESLYVFLSRNPGAIAQFNHIAGPNFRSFRYSASADSSFALCEGQNTSYTLYHIPLDSGWRVGASCGADNHDMTWGKSGFRTGIWATELTKEAVFEAVRANRTFGTHRGWHVSMAVRCGDVWMGGEVRPGVQTFTIDVSDTVPWRNLKLVTNGRKVVDSVSVNAKSYVWTPTVAATAGSYYYVIGYDSAGLPTWSSPIWVVAAPSVDVGIVGSLTPAGVNVGNVSVVPTCSVHNFGTVAATYTVRMTFGYFYSSLVTVAQHAPGTTREVRFRPVSLITPGVHPVACWLFGDNDENPANDVKMGSYGVLR